MRLSSDERNSFTVKLWRNCVASLKREVEVWESWNPNAMCGLGFEIEDWFIQQRTREFGFSIFFFFMFLFLSLNDVVLDLISRDISKDVHIQINLKKKFGMFFCKSYILNFELFFQFRYLLCVYIVDSLRWS